MVLIWAIVYFRGEFKDLSNVDKKGLIFLFLSGMATGFSWIFYFKAIAVGIVSQVTFVDKLSVVLTLILAAVFLKETLSLIGIMACVLIVTGVLILIWPK